MRAGRDVEEHHLIGPLLVVAEGQLHRIADVAQFPGLGLSEPDAARDLARMHVQARNDSLCYHDEIFTLLILI